MVRDASLVLVLVAGLASWVQAGEDPRAGWIAERVIEAQERLTALSAEFDLTVEGIAPWRSEVPAERAIVQGRVQWARDATREFVSFRYDLPERQRIGPFQEERWFVDLHEARTILNLKPTNQVLVTREPGIGTVPGPGDLLSFGFRTDLRTLMARGASIDRVHEDNGAAEFELHVPSAERDAAVVDVTLLPEFDYAIGHWQRRGGWGATIEWRDGENGPIPAVAVLQTLGGDRRWTFRATRFETTGPAPEELNFRFEPGMVVTDYEKGTLARPRVYRIKSCGAPEALVFLEAPRSLTTSQLLAAGAFCGLIVAIGLAYRFIRN